MTGRLEGKPVRRVVLDTSTVVAAVRSVTGASNALLIMALEGVYETVASTAIFLEYESVLQRREQRLVHGRSLEDVNLLLASLAEVFLPVDVRFQWRPSIAG